MRGLIRKLAIALLSCAGIAHAAYPEKPIQIVVPFAAAGNIDIVARLVGDPLAKALGVPVYVENKAGASGMIGSRFVASAKPDGYTLLANSSIHVIVPSLYTNVGYDALNDFQPVSRLTSVPLVMVAAPSAPFKTLADMLAWGAKQANGVSYASAGNGSTPHLAGELLGREAKIKMVHVPYKGSGAAIIDVMGGQVPVMFDALTAVMNYIKTGKLVALAVAAEKRSPILPDVPTFAELGYQKFDLSTWHGIWAPKGTPKPVVDKLAKELQQIVKLPDVQKRISDLGGQAVGSTPAEFDAYARSEYKKWGDMIKELGVTIN